MNLQNYRVQPLADCCCVWKLPNSAVPAHWRTCQTHRGMLFQEEG
ncbi:hypothetical protein LINPERPRIM_LOCUS22990 [Linum perenne]